jgi:nucleoside-diphosphate-sugar epimerase
MPNDDTVLITGANGEIGHGLIDHLHRTRQARVITTDIQPLDRDLKPKCQTFLQGDITQPDLIGQLGRLFELDGMEMAQAT